MATHCIFKKSFNIWTVTVLTITSHVLNVGKLGCLLSLLQKKNRTENPKILLQKNCINNIGLK